MGIRRRTAVAGSVAAVAVAGGTWMALAGSDGGGPHRLVEVPVATPSTVPTATPTPTLTAPPSPRPLRTTPAPHPSATARPTPATSRRPSPTPTPSPTPGAVAADVGMGPYRSVLPRVGYGFCPCDVYTFRTVKPAASALSLSCTPPGKLPSGRLVPLTLTVSNPTSAPLRFTELAGPRFVYLSLANDPGRTKDMTGGFADNAGHTSSSNGWWADPASSSYQQGAGTVSHTVPAHGHLTFTVLGATVRTKDARPLAAGPYTLEAGFLLDTKGDAWTCSGVSATVG